MLEDSRQLDTEVNRAERVFFDDLKILSDIVEGNTRASLTNSDLTHRLLNHLANRNNDDYKQTDYIQDRANILSKETDFSLRNILGEEYLLKINTKEIQTKIYNILTKKPKLELSNLKPPSITLPRAGNSLITTERIQVVGNNKILLKNDVAYKSWTNLDSSLQLQNALTSKFKMQLDNLQKNKNEAAKIADGEHAIIIDYVKGGSSSGYLVQKNTNGISFKAAFYISASSKGTGHIMGSKKTPTGSFAIVKKYPRAARIKETGESITPFNKEGYKNGVSLFTTAAFSLTGLDKDNFNSVKRGILLHGTPLENTRFFPAHSENRSSSCPTMTNSDMSEAAEIIENQFAKQGNLKNQVFRVEITESKYSGVKIANSLLVKSENSASNDPLTLLDEIW